MKMRALLDYLSAPVVAVTQGVVEPVAAAVADQTSRRRTRGRKPGSGALNDDAPILDNLAVGATPSVYAAADKAVDRAQYTGTRVNARRRLARKFSKRFGTEPVEGKSWAEVERELNLNSPVK
jgi:hypothetical protein